MRTITAHCPYCRVGGVRAPASAIGSSATCPKCGSSFTVVPSDAALPSVPPPPPVPLPVPVEQAKTFPLMPEVAEPSPVLVAEEIPQPQPKPKAKPKAKPAPETEPESEPVEETEPTDMGMVVALVALILVGPAVLATQFPFGRFIAIGLAGLGLAAGVMSLGAEGRGRLYSLVATVLHFLILVLVLLLPGWLGLTSWRGSGDDAPKGPFAVANDSGVQTPLSPDEWIDARTASWENKSARVAVRASVGSLELIGPKGAKRFTKEQYITLLVRVTNVGLEGEIVLAAWASGQGTDGVRVTTADGKVLAPATFDGPWQPERSKPTSKLQPQQVAEVRLLYVAPPGKVESVRVQLPAPVTESEEQPRFVVRPGSLSLIESP